jgi:hypothetical protein
VQRARVDNSFSVRSVGYDAATQRLQIEFRSGRVYEYDAVPSSVHEWLMRVRNKGAFITRMVTDKYRFRVVPEDPTELGDTKAASASLEESLRASLDALASRTPK